MFVLAVCAVLISFFVEGYQFGSKDMAVYLSLVNHIENPSLYPNDILVRALPAHHSFFWHGVAALTSESTRPWFFLILYVAVSFSCAWLFILLGQRMLRNQVAVVILVALFIKRGGVPGGYFTEIGFSELTQTQFALPFLLLSLLFFLRGRFVPAMGLATAMLFIQGQMAFYFLFSYALALVPELRRIGWKETMKIFLISGAIALPLLFQSSLIHQSISEPRAMNRYVELAYCRLSHNIAVLNWSYGQWQPLLILALPGWIGVKLTGTFNKDRPIEHKRLLRLLPGTAILMLCGFVFVELYPIHPLFIQLMLFRSAMIVVLALSICACMFVTCLILDKRSSWRILGLTWLCILVLHKAPPLLLALLSLYTLFVLKKGLRSSKAHSPSKAFLQFAVIAVASLFAALGLKRLLTTKSYLPYRLAIDSDWREVQVWARNNTSVDTLFVSPLHETGFRLISQRSTVAEYKDGAPLVFSPLLMIEWGRRIEAFGLTFDTGLSRKDVKSAFTSLSERALTKIASEYNASYLIVQQEKNFDLPPIYWNDSFVVYRLE